MSASRSPKSIITTSVFGSADLCDAMHANILPRTFSVGWPQVVVTSTSGKARPKDSIVLKLLGCGIPVACHRNAHHPSKVEGRRIALASSMSEAGVGPA